MPSDDEINRLRNEIPGDEEIEATFRRLRQEGRSRQEAVRLVLDALDVSLREAKELLARIDTWKEARSAAGQETESGRREDARDDPVPPAPA
ncbi:MAG: hypothetical protein ABEL04_06945 [Salinibacter sp.]|uniref:hypothetical protein n=1 Tax=Salinibacter sp. TaxID=2065818 RepID=UPI0035D495C5